MNKIKKLKEAFIELTLLTESWEHVWSVLFTAKFSSNHFHKKYIFILQYYIYSASVCFYNLSFRLFSASRPLSSHYNPQKGSKSEKKVFVFKFLGVGWDWVHLVCRPLSGRLYQPQMIYDDECDAVSGMRIGRGNRSTRRKPAPVLLCPPQIPHDLTWDQTGPPQWEAGEKSLIISAAYSRS
jgi:hypothetical protein